MSNKYIHIVTHYLALTEKAKRSDAYTVCSQHPLTFKIIGQKGAHLNCMERLKQEKEASQKMTVLNEDGKEENPSEHFWLIIA